MCLRHLVLVAFLLNVPSLLTAADTRVPPRQGPIVPESQAAREDVQFRTDIPEAAIRQMTELVVTDSGHAHGTLVGTAREIAPVIRIDGASVAKMNANVEAEALRDGFAVVRTSSGWTWTAAIESPHAEGLRLFLKSAADSDPFRAWIYSNEGEVHGPYMSDEMSGYGFWTNTIYSARAYVQVQSVSPRISLEIPKVAHLEPRRFASGIVRPQGTECLLDVSCAPEFSETVNILSGASARLVFLKGNNFYTCSGSLLNVDKENDSTPYLLTANHCFDTQQSASSVEALWRYRTTSCGSPVPNPSTLPRTLGSTLLATSAQSDFTFVRLNGTPPSGSWFLGWDPNLSSIVAGLTLVRVSNSGGGPQIYSRSNVVMTSNTCSIAPRPEFVYSTQLVGGIDGGSSGAPVQSLEGYVVGQLLGACGTDLQNPCNTTSNRAVDGSFAFTYPLIKQWLRPEAAPPTGCRASSTTVCLQGNRFEVKVSARDHRTGKTDSGYVMQATNFFGQFAFPVIAGNQTDPQILIKLLDGRPVNGKWWVFFATLTDVEFTLSVRDTNTNITKNFYKAPSSTAATFDTEAF